MNERMGEELPEMMAVPEEGRPWPVRALTLLLFVQTIGLLIIAFNHFLLLDMDESAAGTVARIILTFNVLSQGIALGALSLLSLLASISFGRLWRTGWSNAMLVQGMTLLVALVLYFREPVLYDYLMMVYSIFMVVYLHHPDVLAAFSVKQILQSPE